MNRLFSLSARRLVAPVTVASTILCTSSTRAEEGGKEESDPYANLPEEDERTTCTVCLVNRQGPCRDYWRKFEKCLKDHPLESDKEGEDEEANATPDTEHEHPSAACDRFMLPWLTCIQSYRNMYTLYFNYLNQLELIEPIEKDIRDDEFFVWKDVDVDWTPYVDWVKSQGHTLWELHWRLKQKAPPITPRPKFEGEDPEMIEVEVKVKLEDGGLPIQVVYAKDQGGLLLGMEMFGKDKKETTEGTLKFSFRPEMTSNIQFCALYKKDDGEEARFLCSAPQPLVKVAMEAGGIPEGEF